MQITKYRVKDFNGRSLRGKFSAHCSVLRHFADRNAAKAWYVVHYIAQRDPKKMRLGRRHGDFKQPFVERRKWTL